MPLPKEAEGKPEFEFEIEGEDQGKPVENEVAAKGKPEVDIEIEDDTPEEDRGRTPLPQEIVQELEADELEEYSDKVKTRLKQMKKVWHDERRAKEAAFREQQEALSLAQQAIEENKRLKSRLSEGEKSFIDTAKSAAELEMEMAKRAYKEAYESGDSDKVVDAQEQLAAVNYKLQQIKNYKPSLQNKEIAVNSPQEQISVPKPDPKASSWQERNPWFGRDRLMTSLALGLHEDLVAQHGQAYATTDEYYQRIDKTIRDKFPENFGDEIKTTNGGGKPVTRTDRPATVVAPASRSTSSKKIVLKQSQLMIAKKLGLTPEQYAREFAKTQEN
jgi:type II secretory pathway pseudopilin PulG